MARRTWKDYLRAEVKRTGNYNLDGIEDILSTPLTDDRNMTLRGDGSFATGVGVTGETGPTGPQGETGIGVTGDTGPTGPLPVGGVVFGIDSTTVPTTGYKQWIYFPFEGTIKKWVLSANTTGSIVIDVWECAKASYPPTVANTICAGNYPTLSSAQTAEDSTLAGWDTSIPSGGVYFGFNINSIATITKFQLYIEIEKVI